jgi:hypothetical protein
LQREHAQGHDAAQAMADQVNPVELLLRNEVGEGLRIFV